MGEREVEHVNVVEETIGREGVASHALFRTIHNRLERPTLLLPVDRKKKIKVFRDPRNPYFVGPDRGRLAHERAKLSDNTHDFIRTSRTHHLAHDLVLSVVIEFQGWPVPTDESKPEGVKSP